MHTVSAEHAQAHFAELLDEAVHGEDVAIDVGENMVVRWVVEKGAGSAATGTSVFGMLKGKVRMAADFDEIPEGFEEYVK